jgi:hypothetical protein
MKHLLTAIACFFALSMSAQFPYNPDSNSDNLVGIDDLLDLLPLYGDEFYPDGSPVIQYYSDNEWLGNDAGLQPYYINDSIDIFIIGDIINDTEFILPAGNTYRTMKVAIATYAWSYIRIGNSPGNVLSFCHPTSSEFPGTFPCNWGVNYFRLPDGIWYGDKNNL